MESIHGHEVIHLIAEADRAFSRQELVGVIATKFGANARFHTCSAEDLSADGLVGFLVERGKLFGDEHSLALDASKVCQH